MLHHIRKRGGVSRGELAELCSLSSGAVTRFGRQLIELGLIIEGTAERAAAGAGRPAQSLSLRAQAGAAFGFAVHPGWLESVAINFDGAEIASCRDELDVSSAADVANAARAFVERIRDRAAPKVFGAGFAVPGYATTEPGRRRTVDSLARWRDLDLPAYFSAALGLRTFVENDASAAVLAENYAPGARASTVLLAVTLGAGVGGGAMVDGQLVRGAHGNAGEIGWLYPYGKPRPSALDYLEYVDPGGSLQTRIDDDVDLDATARRWCRRAGRQLVAAVNAGAGWLDPDRIVLTGSLPIKVLEETSRQLALQPLFENQRDIARPVPVASGFGARAAATGAAHLPFHALSFPSAVS